MSYDALREKRAEKATRDLLDAHDKLVSAAAELIADGETLEWLGETVDGMSEATAKAMLMARMVAEAVQAQGVTERNEEVEAA